VLNGVVKSAPVFQGKITGTGIITGDFTTGEVDELVKVLKTGSLRVEPVLLSKESIGPTLGSESIHRGLISLASGGALVFVFMIWYYGIAGTIACVMLLLNLLMLWAAMLFMQATITLPGLGGIVLTLGMAVDANVLIYERIREERENGKDILRAVRAGFERAMSAIMDSNVASFLAALVLYNIGTGPVRGFAVTLMIGIVTTLFTQFFVTRIAFHIALERKWLDNWRPHSLLTKANIDFVHYMRMNVTISIVMVLGGVLFALFGVPREEMLGMDFTGGANLQMAVSQPMDAAEVRGMLLHDAEFNRDYPNCTVNTVGKLGPGDRAVQFNLRLKLTDTQRARIEQERKEWREAHKKAEDAHEQAPAEYQPPYQIRLREVFSQQLVKPAFSDPLTTPLPNNDRMQFAQIYLHFQEPIAVNDARQKVGDAKLPQAVVSVPNDKDAVTSKDILLEWHTLASTPAWELFDIARTALASLKTADGNAVVLSNPFPAAQEIQGRLVYDLRNAAIGALILSWVLIGLYLRVRFHDYSFGVAAVLSLIHDVAIAFGAIVVANHFHLVHAEIDLNMVACFLTIIGYSVNDTIVIFDRIREVVNQNQRLGRVEAFRDVINHAINKTLSRTVLTHGVTMFVVIAQFFVNLGSESGLESFAFGMIIGIVTGTYSSIFIAAPILIWLHKDKFEVPGHPIAPAAATTPAPTPAS
jgi:SecD/SecF fusion protein